MDVLNQSLRSARDRLERGIVKIDRIHYHAKSGVLSQRITTSMHNTTHIDAPAHVVQGTPFIDEVPLPHFFGSGIVVAIPKKQWEPITYDDLEKAGVDSMAVLKILVFIESTYGFWMPDEDLLEENIASIRAFANYIRRRGTSPLGDRP